MGLKMIESIKYYYDGVNNDDLEAFFELGKKHSNAVAISMDLENGDSYICVISGMKNNDPLEDENFLSWIETILGSRPSQIN